MKLRIPRGYTPATYEELAHIAGLPVSEARKCADEMVASGIVNIIRVSDNFIFYKLNLKGGRDV